MTIDRGQGSPISSLTTTGISDNADAVAITIASNEDVTFTNKVIIDDSNTGGFIDFGDDVDMQLWARDDFGSIFVTDRLQIASTSTVNTDFVVQIYSNLTDDEYLSLGVGTNLAVIRAGHDASGQTDLVIKTSNTSGSEAERFRFAYNEMTSQEDIKVVDSSKGLVLKSPDGTYWRVTVNNSGTLSTASL